MDFFNLFQDDQNTFIPLIYFGLTKEEIIILTRAYLDGKSYVKMNGRTFKVLTETFLIYSNDQVFESSEKVQLFFKKLGFMLSPNPILEEDLISYGKNVTKEILSEITGKENNIEIIGSETQDYFWPLIHESIIKVSRELYTNSHYKESVQAASVEVISRVKKIYRVRVINFDNDLDGKNLMMKVFHQDDPIIKIVSENVEDARGIQEGYKFLFAGVALAIRNPKAHQNFIIKNRDAIELLFLCSRLIRKLDEAMTEYMYNFLVGKWKNEWRNDKISESEPCEFTSDRKYFKNGKHSFDIKDLKVEDSLDVISFIKSSVIPDDNRELFNKLRIINTKLLEGNEDNFKITYSRIE